MTTNLLLPVALGAGFFGSTHCIAMCGAIVMLFENDGRRGTGWLRRAAYNSGRMAFYALLGAAAGASGALLTSGIGGGLLALRFLAAVAIVLIGLDLVFEWRVLAFLERSGAWLWKRLSTLARYVVPIRSPATAVAAGFIWGALPCGLVYSAVALAATAGSTAGGAAVMIAFWLGTLPALLLAGASAHRLQAWRSDARLRRIAGAVMVLVGFVALVLPLQHGSSQHDSTHEHPVAADHADTGLNEAFGRPLDAGGQPRAGLFRYAMLQLIADVESKTVQ